MFELTDKPIAVYPLADLHAHAGGIVTFEGRVRAVNDGKAVTSLEYEAYDALALSEGNAIIEQASAQFGLYHAYGIHRTGHLAIGEIAVWIYVAAQHRREAFAACEHIIHEIKHRLPIWKKERYADGACEWVRCGHSA